MATPSRSGLRLTMFADIDRDPRKSWLVGGLLGEGELSVVFGAPSAGKSVLATDLSFHIAAGRPWLGRSVTQGGVLYIAAERAALVERRLAALRKHHGVDDVPFGLLRGQVDLTSSGATADEIIENAKRLSERIGQPVRFIAIDTVSRALAGGDENSPRDMGRFVLNASIIQDATGAGMCLIHHTPGDGAPRLRGHTALLGAVDTTILVEQRGQARTATVMKQTDGEEGVALAFNLASVPIGEGTTAPVVVGARMPEERTKQRRLSDRAQNALNVLREMAAKEGQQVSGDGLPSGFRAVPVETWRARLYEYGVLDRDHKNPREDFRRVKSNLLARKLVHERDGRIGPTR